MTTPETIEPPESRRLLDRLVGPDVPDAVAEYAKNGACCLCVWYQWRTCHRLPPGALPTTPGNWCGEFSWNKSPALRAGNIAEIPGMTVSWCNVLEAKDGNLFEIANLLEYGRHRVLQIDGIGKKAMAVLDASLSVFAEWR